MAERFAGRIAIVTGAGIGGPGAAYAETAGADDIASFDRTIDRVPTVTRIEPDARIDRTGARPRAGGASGFRARPPIAK